MQRQTKFSKRIPKDTKLTPTLTNKGNITNYVHLVSEENPSMKHGDISGNYDPYCWLIHILYTSIYGPDLDRVQLSHQNWIRPRDMEHKLPHPTNTWIADGNMSLQEGGICLLVSQGSTQEKYHHRALHAQGVVDTSNYGIGILLDLRNGSRSGYFNVHQHQVTRVQLFHA